jgi:transposase-like protein
MDDANKKEVPTVKEQVIKLYDAGKSVGTIAKELNINYDRVYQIVTRYLPDSE